MSGTIEQTAIRAQLTIVSNPPVAPIDINTGLAPAFWRGAGVEIDVGIFNNSGNGVDLSNLAALVLTLQQSNTSLIPLVTKILYGNQIQDLIYAEDWEDGETQNARFILTPADTDQGLQASGSLGFWRFDHTPARAFAVASRKSAGARQGSGCT